MAHLGARLYDDRVSIMTTPNRGTLLIAPALAAAGMLLLASCGGDGPPPIRTGTPAYYFQTAKEAYGKGDFAKATEWLDKINKANKNEFSGRAWVFRLLLETGSAAAYRDLAEYYEYGRRSNKDNPTPFIKKVTEYRGIATRMTLPLGELYASYETSGPEAETVIDFPFPSTGTTTRPPQLTKISQGIAPTEDEARAALKGSLDRGIVLAICNLVGAKEDAAKGRAALQTLPVKVPRAEFELAMAKALYEAAQLHGAKFSGSPAVQEFLCQQALKAFASVSDDSKETKALKANIEKELKDAAKRKG